MSNRNIKIEDRKTVGRYLAYADVWHVYTCTREWCDTCLIRFKCHTCIGMVEITKEEYDGVYNNLLWHCSVNRK